MSREAMLASIRSALGRSEGAPVADPPPVRLRIPTFNLEERIQQFHDALVALNAHVYHADDAASATAYVAALLENRSGLASNAPLLSELAIAQLPGVLHGVTDLDQLRAESAVRAVGITSASYALADTGSLVMLSSVEEARLVSLLPPIHLAVVPVSKLLTGLDELFTFIPRPKELSSSMVLITGPSRTADIEQILVRGVHGPGELHVVILADH